MKKYLQKLGQNSYKASLEKVDTNTKNKVLLKFSDLIKKNLNKILKQNKKEIPGEFLGRLVLGVEDGEVKVFGATIY